MFVTVSLPRPILYGRHADFVGIIRPDFRERRLGPGWPTIHQQTGTNPRGRSLELRQFNNQKCCMRGDLQLPIAEIIPSVTSAAVNSMLTAMHLRLQMMDLPGRVIHDILARQTEQRA